MQRLVYVLRLDFGNTNRGSHRTDIGRDLLAVSKGFGLQCLREQKYAIYF
jgi:hypothetical protein